MLARVCGGGGGVIPCFYPEVQALSTRDVSRIAGLFAADYILTAAITDFDSSVIRRSFILLSFDRLIYTVGLTARLIDVGTGAVVWIGSPSVQADAFADAAVAVSRTAATSIRSADGRKRARTKQGE